MLKSFFAAAMLAPGRQRSFRRIAVVHVSFLAALGWSAGHPAETGQNAAIGYLALILGIVEGASLVGWRLTQMPKSQALEFLLVSPLRPGRLFLYEFSVGAARFGLVCLAGMPAWLGMVATGTIELSDLWPLVLMPFIWGLVAGVGLTVWAYEPASVRRVGEFVALGGVLCYLVVGILAGEHLRLWLTALPPSLASAGYEAFQFLHNSNPFGVVRGWFDRDREPRVVWERFVGLNGFGIALVGAFGARAAFRLRGHFHERHYRPISSDRAAQTERIGDRPLSWWAVRRVMEYSGRVNVWLAGGFSLLYAAFLVAGDDWPRWMGRLVFQIFETWGGAPAVAAAMAVMAAVPAAFQFGLWDPTVQDRCRRLELLLLTDLDGRDYWHASLAAAWRRGRGYLAIASVLWTALAVSGRTSPLQAAAAALGGCALWLFSFAVGFRAFSTGNQASGVASLLTLGMPLLLYALLRMGFDSLAAFVPTAACYLPAATGATWSWALGLSSMVAATVVLTRSGWADGDAALRRWFDANQGLKSAG